MQDTVTYNDIMNLSPEEKEQFSRYANAKLSKLACKCTDVMKIRGSDNLCLDCRKEYWDRQVVMGMEKVEEMEELIQKRNKEKENEMSTLREKS